MFEINTDRVRKTASEEAHCSHKLRMLMLRTNEAAARVPANSQSILRLQEAVRAETEKMELLLRRMGDYHRTLSQVTRLYDKVEIRVGSFGRNHVQTHVQTNNVQAGGYTVEKIDSSTLAGMRERLSQIGELRF